VLEQDLQSDLIKRIRSIRGAHDPLNHLDHVGTIAGLCCRGTGSNQKHNCSLSVHISFEEGHHRTCVVVCVGVCGSGAHTTVPGSLLSFVLLAPSSMMDDVDARGGDTVSIR
jgi:hypothetical protein